MMANSVEADPPELAARVVLERRGTSARGWWWMIMADGQTLASSERSFSSSEDAFEAGETALGRTEAKACP